MTETSLSINLAPATVKAKVKSVVMSKDQDWNRTSSAVSVLAAAEYFGLQKLLHKHLGMLGFGRVRGMISQ